MATQDDSQVIERPHENVRIKAFKLKQFERLGFGDISEAMVDQGVDWHQAEDLINKGWPMHWVLRVLF
jgi:hypothetical protein